MTALALDDPRHGTRRGYHLGCRRGSCPLPRYHDCTAAASHERYLRRIGELPPMAPGVGVKRRLQALKVRGWSGAELSRRLGYSDRTLVDQMIRERTLFEHATWVAVCWFAHVLRRLLLACVPPCCLPSSVLEISVHIQESHNS